MDLGLKMDLGCSHVCTATMTLTLFGLEDNGLYLVLTTNTNLPTSVTTWPLP